MNVEKRQEIERKVVLRLIRMMKANGWNATRVDDGGDELIKCKSDREVMDAVFAVDEAKICFTKGKTSHWAVIILGNDGWDCISDYTYGMKDDFEKVMILQVDPYCKKLEMENS